MHDGAMPMRAAIDMGSNTIRLVVARCAPEYLERVVREEEMVRIGESVNKGGTVSEEKLALVVKTLRRYKALAAQYTSELPLLVATAAVRKATNKDEFLADIKKETGLEVAVIGGEEEAFLTFAGATSEFLHNGAVPQQIAVMDLGGGSTELVTARNGRITWQTSLPVGSGWLHDRYLLSDPPGSEDLEVATTFLHAFFKGTRVRSMSSLLVVTGGSATALLELARHAFGLGQHVSVLKLDDVLRCEGLLSALSAQEIAQRYSLPSSRARILPSGTLIIRTVMECSGMREVHISDLGVREGVLLARQRYGEHWLDVVQQRAGKFGNTTALSNGKIGTVAIESQGESFAHTGRRMLQERAQAMLELRSEVLKQEDIEAVHKMRVASRRLRAVLDAYQSICAAKPFRKVYRRVKQLADVLGKARDTDVMIENLSHQMEQAAPSEQVGIRWLIIRLENYRQQHQQAVENFLEQFDEQRFLRHLEACLPGEGR